uniref:Uncharacterized protein n=1 Tax=Anguilla anguilla TaxID=7936 RepID=A0A0E9TQW3_ANGAN
MDRKANLTSSTNLTTPNLTNSR